MARDNRNDPTPYAVYCNRCHCLRWLSQRQYLAQLISPYTGWRCPDCNGHAEWDDDCQETNPPEDSVELDPAMDYAALTNYGEGDDPGPPALP